MAHLGAILCLFFFVLLSIEAKKELIHPKLRKGNKKNPGAVMRLTEKGFNYINDVAMEGLEREVIKMHIADIRHEIPNPKGVVELNDVKLTKFDIGDSRISFTSPNEFRWQVSEVDVTVTGYLGGKLVVPLKGKLTVIGTDLSTVLTGRVRRSKSTNKFKVATTSCGVKFGKIDLNVADGGLAGAALNTNAGIKKQALDSISPGIRGGVCSKAREFVDQHMNSFLAKIPFKQSLGELASYGMGDKEMKKLEAIFPKWKKLWVDYRLMNDVSTQQNFLQSQHIGEISKGGDGDTPFKPYGMNIGSDASSKMMYLYISDYLANSLLFHAYKMGMLRIRITPDHPEMGKYLKTTCGSGSGPYCVGDFLPGLSEKYPNRKLDIMIDLTPAPSIFFEKDNGGTVKLTGGGWVYLLVRNPKRRTVSVLLKNRLKFKSTSKFKIRDRQYLTGDVKFDKFDLKLKKSHLKKVDNKVIQDLKFLIENELERRANTLLGNGMPLPNSINGVSLEDPEIKVGERHIRLSTDYEIDEDMIGDMLRKMFK